MNRLRRLRQSPIIRKLVEETTVSVDKLIQPFFVVDGIKAREPIPAMTGVYRETPDTALAQIEKDLEAGVRSFILFGVPSEKKTDEMNFDFTAEQVRRIKSRFGSDLFLSVDVCLCSHTTHGHCGILDSQAHHVQNDQTVKTLARAALAYAQAGADCVAPSDMMDGRIKAIRETLHENDLDETLLMSYAAKFHSKFYGPFRVAADSAPDKTGKLKDRATYQINPANRKEALLCALRDEKEGADILMVKPGMPYLDVLYELSQKINKPWAVYEVSGEYASIELLARENLISAPHAHLEAWTSFFRAGAQMILTYGARSAREYLKNV